MLDFIVMQMQSKPWKGLLGVFTQVDFNASFDQSLLSCSKSHHCRDSVAEVDSGVKKYDIQSIPKLVINGVSPEEQPEGTGDEKQDKDSDAGSAYDGSVYGPDSHHGGSREDLSTRGHLDLQLK